MLEEHRGGASQAEVDCLLVAHGPVPEVTSGGTERRIVGASGKERLAGSTQARSRSDAHVVAKSH